jgi:hypothetical protein
VYAISEDHVHDVTRTCPRKARNISKYPFSAVGSKVDDPLLGVCWGCKQRLWDKRRKLGLDLFLSRHRLSVVLISSRIVQYGGDGSCAME